MVRRGAPADGQGLLELDLPAPLTRVSPALLGELEACPRRYRLRRLDRVTEYPTAQAHRSVGSTVHQVLQAWWALPVAERTPDGVARLVRRWWVDGGFRDEQQVRRVQGAVRGWLTDYVRDHLVGASTPLRVEWSVAYRTATTLMAGKLDRIDDRDGTLVVVDYKTGRWVPSDADAAASTQLAAYAQAASQVLRRPVRRVELHHVPSGTVASHEHSAASLAAEIDRVDAVVADLAGRRALLEAGEDPDRLFPTRAGEHCVTCEVRSACPVGRLAPPTPVGWASLPAALRG